VRDKVRDFVRPAVRVRDAPGRNLRPTAL
jgi:hypothetical protein